MYKIYVIMPKVVYILWQEWLIVVMRFHDSRQMEHFIFCHLPKMRDINVLNVRPKKGVNLGAVR